MYPGFKQYLDSFEENLIILDSLLESGTEEYTILTNYEHRKTDEKDIDLLLSL